jgi:hypothetical protein
MHLVYIDDSRDGKLACFSALAVPAEVWHVTLDRLIAIRRILRETDGVPMRFELHATDWLGGKGYFVRPIRRPDRVRIYNYILAGITLMPSIQLFNASVPKNKEELAFERLMNRINVNMRKSAMRLSSLIRAKITQKCCADCGATILSKANMAHGREARRPKTYAGPDFRRPRFPRFKTFAFNSSR